MSEKNKKKKHRKSTENLMPPWKPGESGNPDGYPKGKRNRSTIAREIANTVLNVPDKAHAKLKELYPDMPKKQQVETLMMWQQALKAIAERDTKAFQAIMDCLYGKPSQEVTQNVTQSPTKIVYEEINPEDERAED